jgi:DNA transformation protein
MFDPDGAAAGRFVDHVVDLLGPLDAVARRMFGGHGIFVDGLMFALIADDRLYFKADDASRAAFEAAGGEPFTYLRRGRPASLSYYGVPDDALEDREALLEWAGHGIAAARRAAASRRGKAKRAGAPK